AAAVPVRDADGEVRAGLAVHAPSSRMSVDQACGHLPAMHDAATRIARLL
ncbi:MAG: IclR family transcriptional regulator C-terminal domain-containing protein, partial [Burkholderiaceae bacterium]